jgi:hypothetical protein
VYAARTSDRSSQSLFHVVIAIFTRLNRAPHGDRGAPEDIMYVHGSGGGPGYTASSARRARGKCMARTRWRSFSLLLSIGVASCAADASAPDVSDLDPPAAAEPLQLDTDSPTCSDASIGGRGADSASQPACGAKLRSAPEPEATPRATTRPVTELPDGRANCYNACMAGCGGGENCRAFCNWLCYGGDSA